MIASVPCSVKTEHKFGLLKRNMCVRHASGRAESVERLIVPHRWSNWLLRPKLHPFPSSRSQQIQPRSRQRVNVHLHHLLFRCRCSSHHLLLRTKNSTYRFRRARDRGGVAPYPQDHIPFHVVQWSSREPAVCVLTFRTIHHDHLESTQSVLAKVTGAPQQPASKFQSLAPVGFT